MLVSDDAQLIGDSCHLATQAWDPAPRYEHSHVDCNYRMSNLAAAEGRGQLTNLPAKVARHQHLNRQYRCLLGSE